MANANTYIIQLASWLAQAIGDGRVTFANFNTEMLGINLPQSVFDDLNVTSALNAAESSAEKVGAAGSALAAAADLAAILELGMAITEFYVAIDDLVSAIKTHINDTTELDAVERATAEQFARNLAKMLSDVIVAYAITDRAPSIAFILRLLGLLDWRYIPKDADNTLSSAHVLRKLALHRVKDLFNDPAKHYKESLGWGDSSFDPIDLFSLYREFWDEETDIEAGIAEGEPFLRMGSFRIARDSTTDVPSLVLSMIAELKETIQTRRELNENWDANVSSSMLMTGEVSGRLSPPLSLSFLPVEGSITGELRAFIDRNPTMRPFEIVDGIGIVSIIADNLTTGIGLDASWDVDDKRATINPLVYANLDGITLRIGVSDADSFIGRLLAESDIEGKFDLGLRWQADTGLRIEGSGGMDIALPIHKQIGPIGIQTIYIALRILQDGALSLELSTALKGTLGAINVAVDRMGVLCNLRLAEGVEARYGLFDLELGFNPPAGAGIALAPGPITGGGFLDFDPDNARYTGIVSLQMGKIGLTAIGLIATRMPDGSDGYSMVINIGVTFDPPILLRFGFTLNGVGGLLAMNRQANIGYLRDGLRAGTLDSILFPENAIANANQIISDMRAAFPITEGRFVLGPMVKLAWGSPSIIEADICMLFELPEPIRIILLGQVAVMLPVPKEAIVKLHLDVLGAIDISRKSLAIDAVIYDSKILAYTLTGDAAFRLIWGDTPAFALSVGGFHPAFTPPPAFPALRRLTLDLSGGKNLQLNCQMYLALTANSLQFGSRIDLYANYSKAVVEGNLNFDTLICFDPFSFIVSMRAGVTISYKGKRLASVRLLMDLSGPAPWRAWGEATFELLFWTITVEFDETWGPRRITRLAPTNPWVPLEQALLRNEGWSSVTEVVRPDESYMPSNDGSVLLLHPDGGFEITEKVLPLATTLELLGNAPVKEYNRFEIESILVNGQPIADEAWSYVDEFFARGQFEKLTDNQKLTIPSFEKMAGGVKVSKVSQDELLVPDIIADKELDYESILIDDDNVVKERAVSGPIPWFVAHSEQEGNAKKKVMSEKLNRFASKRIDKKVAVAEESFLIVDRETLKPVVGMNEQGAVSRTMADQQLAQVKRQKLPEAKRYMVVSSFEAEVASL